MTNNFLTEEDLAAFEATDYISKLSTSTDFGNIKLNI